MFNVARLMPSADLAGASFPRRVCLSQMTAQAHVHGDCNAHYDQGTYAKDQEPPDHPHSRLE
jgi:hypothetical protein